MPISLLKNIYYIRTHGAILVAVLSSVKKSCGSPRFDLVIKRIC